MAVFSNQATLTYNGITTNSNVAYGEIIDVITASKTAIEGSYSVGDTVTYVVNLRNTGDSAISTLTVTDDLGAYDFAGTTVYPLTYEAGSATLFVNGVLQADPAVTAGPPLTVTGINIPANGDAVLVYQARVNEFANPAAGGSIVNTATITGDTLGAPITASETVTAEAAPTLTISKTITPSQVVDNERVTYTFVIQNFGNEAVIATDNAAVTDTFDPRLSALTVTFEGTTWTQGVEYNYTEADGLFATVPGQITVPAATVTQDPTTGAYTTIPGVATLTVTGTI